MARVVAHVPDLLFGSKVQGILGAGGHDVALVGTETAVRDALGRADVLVVDLTADAVAGIALLEALQADDLVGQAKTLAFYSHVDADVRRRAIDAGFDLFLAKPLTPEKLLETVEELAIVAGRGG
jgi:CheY-like chemotaxis protein